MLHRYLALVVASQRTDRGCSHWTYHEFDALHCSVSQPGIVVDLRNHKDSSVLNLTTMFWSRWSCHSHAQSCPFCTSASYAVVRTHTADAGWETSTADCLPPCNRWAAISRWVTTYGLSSSLWWNSGPCRRSHGMGVKSEEPVICILWLQESPTLGVLFWILLLYK